MVFIQKRRLATTCVAGKYKYRSLGEVSDRRTLKVKYLIRFLIYSLIVIFTLYFIGNTTRYAVAEDNVLTLESEVERLSAKYKIDSKIVYKVIKCESELYGSAINHNIDKSGKIWSTDYGFLQINDYYHKETMDKLGLDIYNQWDSLEYGFILMKEKGLAPWSASKTCWNK